MYKDNPCTNKVQDKEVILVNQAQEGNEKALIALYQKYLNPIYRYVFSKVGNVQETEDITSEVFLKVVRNLHSFKGESSFKNWLYKIAKNTLADYWRAHYKKSTVSIEEFLEIDLTDKPNPGIGEDIEKEMFKKEQMVDKILNILPENYHLILDLRFLKNYSLKDIANELNITISNVKVLQYRALKKAFEITKELTNL